MSASPSLDPSRGLIQIPLSPSGALPPLPDLLSYVLALYGSAAPPPDPPEDWGEFRDEVESLYRTTRAPTTASKMRQVLDEIDRRRRPKRVSDVDVSAVAEYVRWSTSLGRHPVTIGSMLAYLRAALAYGVRSGRIRSSPFDVWRDWGLDGRARPDTARRHHSAAEIARVLDHLAGDASWSGRRLHALAVTVAYTGLRRSEAIGLQVRDVDVAGRILRVSPRRRLKRPTAAAPVPIPDRLAAVLALWLPDTGSEWCLPGGRRLAPWLHGSTGVRPTARLAAAAAEVGVTGLTLQSLRHSYATHGESRWGLSGGVVQRVLRHTTAATQRHYRHADVANLVAACRGLDYGESAPPPPCPAAASTAVPAPPRS